MACLGSCAPERLGAICPSVTVHGAVSPAVSIAGGAQRWGIGCWPPYPVKPTPRGAWIGKRTGWMPRSCAPIRRRRGQKKSAAEPADVRAAAEALGYSRGGFFTKVHLRAEGQGNPMAIVLTPGQRHE